MLIYQLNKLANELITNHTTVDMGGCCVVAAQMAKYLSKIVPVQIVTGNAWGRKINDTLDDIRPHINSNSKDEWEHNGVYFSHVLIEFEYDGKTYAFDSTLGVVPKDQYWKTIGWTRLEGAFLQEEAEAFANEDSWNEFFSRSEIPTVRRRITNFFKKHFPETLEA